MSLNVDYAQYTENDLGHELINVVVISGGVPIDGLFELNDECGDNVELTLTFAGQTHISQAPTYFEALNNIREPLEKDGIYPKCYGTCENVYPSPMHLSMGVGRLAHKLTLGCPTKIEDIVDLFNVDNSCTPSTIAAQKLFNENWIKSITNRK